MKTLVIFFLTFFALLASAALFGGILPDVALVFASAFTAGLTAWTGHQYGRKFPPLTARARLLRLPMGGTRRNLPAPPRRLAA